ncbi:MAG: hypothetical protein LBR60_00430 [Fibrobacter sp.]|jgi:O-antigen/teichoic acid export membrane protein|nr:hypothetical protein [Fibrobacter sp.]
MTTTSENNKRIAKNTMFLYFRTLLVMFVTLYTSRVVLNTLGVEDFGIYNVVGGVVMMLSFLNSSMASASTRFITFELGTGNQELLKKVFSVSCTLHFLIAIICVLLLEIIGVWFLNYKMNITPDRMGAANWVFQFAIFSFFVTIISVPYNAAIIAHEKMSAFAYISILEVSLKLFIVFLLNWIDFDKLKLYAVLMCLVSVLLRLIYSRYCKKHFEECRKHQFLFDGDLFKKMFGYVGWSLYIQLSYTSYLQGIGILLNLFFGVVANAARGIAVQIQHAVLQFITNFQMAANPQIIKYYSQKRNEEMFNLVFRSCKFSFFLLLMLCIPLQFYMDVVLRLWLKNVPDYAVLFSRLALVISLINIITLPLQTIVQATGKLKINSLLIGTCNLMILPFSYLFLRMGNPPQTVYYVCIFFYVLVLVIRLYIGKRLVDLPVIRFLLKVLFPCMGITLVSVIICYFVNIHMERDFIGLLCFSAVSTLLIGTLVFGVGFNKNERKVIIRKISGKLRKQ